jgi:hypothetical protein
VSLDDLLARCSELESQPATSRGKLWGMPFAVKDNVDVAGIPTTAACEAFKYTPEKSSPAVEQLLAAGRADWLDMQPVVHFEGSGTTNCTLMNDTLYPDGSKVEIDKLV